MQLGRDIELEIFRHFHGVAMFIEKAAATGPSSEIEVAFKVIVGSPPMFRGTTQTGRDIELEILRHFHATSTASPFPSRRRLRQGLAVRSRRRSRFAKQISESQTIWLYTAVLEGLPMMKQILHDNDLTAMATVAHYTCAYEATAKLEWWDKSRRRRQTCPCQSRRWGINDPSVGNRSIQKENFDSLASPVGWHSLPYYVDPVSVGFKPEDCQKLRITTTTWGDNVFIHENWEGRNSWQTNYRQDAGVDLKYVNASVTSLFYMSNLVHDLYYRYSFDEVSGNFQQHNFGRVGEESDADVAKGL
ncbi:hypothetical protein SCP_1502090 [Sparassis crispa]|uniref:Extracellular metalloproteinase n=1 Tax=Sparassis crispa TaxID=139825 RepID=A0A401H475_9APHY|nr:hypothetical protein SCP_1502090 [Sparassis crispa]GBE89201.1 hypothetical protein SCP_1502090 [Sparassis crispa]